MSIKHEAPHQDNRIRVTEMDLFAQIGALTVELNALRTENERLRSILATVEAHSSPEAQDDAVKDEAD